MLLMSKSPITIEDTMSIPNDTNRTAPPTHPGAMLREDFLPDYGLTVASLAAALDVSRQTINELLPLAAAIFCTTVIFAITKNP